MPVARGVQPMKNSPGWKLGWPGEESAGGFPPWLLLFPIHLCLCNHSLEFSGIKQLVITAGYTGWSQPEFCTTLSMRDAGMGEGTWQETQVYFSPRTFCLFSEIKKKKHNNHNHIRCLNSIYEHAIIFIDLWNGFSTFLWSNGTQFGMKISPSEIHIIIMAVKDLEIRLFADYSSIIQSTKRYAGNIMSFLNLKLMMNISLFFIFLVSYNIIIEEIITIKVCLHSKSSSSSPLKNTFSNFIMLFYPCSTHVCWVTQITKQRPWFSLSSPHAESHRLTTQRPWFSLSSPLCFVFQFLPLNKSPSIPRGPLSSCCFLTPQMPSVCLVPSLCAPHGVLPNGSADNAKPTCAL